MEVEVKTSETVVYVLQVCWGTDTIMADAPPPPKKVDTSLTQTQATGKVKLNRLNITT